MASEESCYTYATRKLFRLNDDSIVGLSGCASRFGAYLDWLNEGAKLADFPAKAAEEREKGLSVTVLHIRLDGSAWRYEDTPYPIEIRDKEYASGCGREYAKAAMVLGCTALEAVELACTLDPHCGNGIDTLRLQNE